MTATAHDNENVTAVLVAGNWHTIRRGTFQSVDGGEWIAAEERAWSRRDRRPTARQLLVHPDAIQAVRTAPPHPVAA